MLFVVDALNRHLFSDLLDRLLDMRTRACIAHTAVYGEGVSPSDGLDEQDPALVICLDDTGGIQGCLRLLPTTGPHVLSTVHPGADAPLRSAQLWEGSQLFVDPQADKPARVICELLAGALDYASDAGVLDLVVLLDPAADHALSARGLLRYDYIGRPERGLVAALMDCSEKRIARLHERAELTAQMFLDADQALRLIRSGGQAPRIFNFRADLRAYCDEQIANAITAEERAAAEALRIELAHLLDEHPQRLFHA